MPSSPRITPAASKLHSILTPQIPRISLLPLQTVLQPAAFPTPSSVHTRFSRPITNKWTGSREQDHTVDRSKRNDTTDPTTVASATGMKEREENEGIADDTKSQATTQRGGVKYAKKAKEEHPNAPEPIIGMNDERAQKGH